MMTPFTPEAPEQLSFPDITPSPAGTALLTIEQRFARFHADNPHVYRELRRLALDLVDRGHTRIGIGMLTEVLRWSAMQTRGDDSYKLNNSFRALFARMLADNEPALADVFEFRRLRSHDEKRGSRP